MREVETMRKIRYGFRLMWKAAPRFCRRYDIGAVGTYDPRNCHKGVMWGWPRDRILALDIYIHSWTRMFL